MQPPYHTIEEMLGMVDEPNRSRCVKILSEHRGLFQAARGSTHNHQAWPGGYLDHVQEVMNIAVVLYGFLGAIRPLSFTLSDVLLVLFLHDIEKPWAYVQDGAGRFVRRPDLQTENDQQIFRNQKLKAYAVALTPEQDNAIRYVHGELGDYTGQRRVIGSLGAFCHSCDFLSARLWFDHPFETGDPWTGARRIRG